MWLRKITKTFIYDVQINQQDKTIETLILRNVKGYGLSDSAEVSIYSQNQRVLTQWKQSLDYKCNWAAFGQTNTKESIFYAKMIIKAAEIADKLQKNQWKMSLTGFKWN